MLLACFLCDIPGGVRVLPILRPTPTSYEYRCLQHHLYKESLILVQSPEVLFEPTYVCGYLTSRQHTADARGSTSVSQKYCEQRWGLDKSIGLNPPFFHKVAKVVLAVLGVPHPTVPVPSRPIDHTSLRMGV